MAAALVTVPVDDLLRCWSQGSITRLGPQWGVEAKLQEIKDLLSSNKCFSPEAEGKFPFSFELQDMVRKLKEAVYDAEDLLEELSMEEPLRLRDGKLRRLFRHVEGCWFGCWKRWELRGIARSLRDLTGTLIGIIPTIPAEVQEVLEARDIPFLGRVTEKGEIISSLIDGGPEVNSVLVVSGDWGCGKTALVQEVMKDKGVSGYFDVKIWVNFSPAWDTNRVAQEIIASLREEEDVEEGEVFGLEHSIHLIARHLDCSKRYLFVLDEIFVRDWDREGWWSFRSLMEGGLVASGSKIILVTHSDIWDGREPASWSFNHEVGRMNPEEAVALLRETISQGREAYLNLFNNPQFHEMAGHIVDKCRWKPRMIKAVGGYLSLQPPAAEVWTPLLDMLRDSPFSAFSHLLRGGYPYGDLTSPVVKRYNNLPPRIKRCFSLYSLFPRGHPINPHTLTQLWISLGFIHNNDHDEDDRLRPLEDIAHHYLDVLLREELFRVKKSDIFGKVKYVTLHPHAHELVTSIAGWECLASPVNLPWEGSYAIQCARHGSVIYHSWRTYFPNNKLRTFLHFEEDHTKLKEMNHFLITTLNYLGKRLRVLDLHDVKAEVLPEVIWKLKHLRYLDLSGNTTLQMLPPAITRLLNLQTLKLSGCSSLMELPCDMSNLSALRHLYIDGCWKLSLIPKGLCDLKYLNILTDFILPPDDSSKNIDSSTLRDLCKLNDLRGSLTIRNLGCYDDELMDNGSEGLLDKKCYLESVELRFMNLPTDTSLLEKLQPHLNLKGLRIRNYGGTQFPEWMTLLSIRLPNLVDISLIGCENCVDLHLVGHLPHLKKLTIQELPDLEHLESGLGRSLPEGDDDAQTFGNLSILCIKNCPKLNFLPVIPRLLKLTLVNVSEELFRHPCQLPNLKTLHLENIERLDHLSEEWLRGLASLKELHIGSCHSLAFITPGISHLGTLETLSVWNCKELDLSTDGQGTVVTELQGVKSLRCLTIYKASKMEHLPEWLSHVATLRFLCIRSCPSLVVLPEWIKNLKSLELIHCPRLETLLAGMPDSGDNYCRKMNIIGCPLLQTESLNPAIALSCKL